MSKELQDARKLLEENPSVSDATLRKIQALTAISQATSLEDLAEYERQKLL